VSFSATACGQDGADINAVCKQEFCTQPSGVAYPYPTGCDAKGTDVTATIPANGTCRTNFSTGTHLALASFSRRWRDCALNAGGSFCSSLDLNGNMETGCFDFSSTRAVTQLAPPSTRRDKSVFFSSVVLDSPQCPLIGSYTTATSNLLYEVPAGNIGTASGAGTSVGLAVLRGFVSARQNCSEGCVSTVNRLEVNLADRVVSGVKVTNVVVRNAEPFSFSGVPDPDSGLFAVPVGAVHLVATGRLDGVDSALALQNETTLLVGVTPTQFRLQGSLSMVATDAAGRPLPINITVAVSGTPASAGTQACLALPPLQRLFGFEDPENWVATNAALSLVTSPVTQGCGALGVAGQGFMPISSSPFSTAGLSLKPALSVDLFIPPNQPNLFYLGALQMYLTCPASNVFNQYIGQVELTGKPLNRYSTLRFPLPSTTSATLAVPQDGCFLSFGLNVNPTGQNWLLDNLRFTP
jgi:hypothetical protein